MKKAVSIPDGKPVQVITEDEYIAWLESCRDEMQQQIEKEIEHSKWLSEKLTDMQQHIKTMTDALSTLVCWANVKDESPDHRIIFSHIRDVCLKLIQETRFNQI